MTDRRRGSDTDDDLHAVSGSFPAVAPAPRTRTERMDAIDRTGDWSSDRSLVSTMVHDLKNPLAALAGNLALLREELIGVELGPTANRCLDDSVTLCTRALMMAQSIGDIEALEAGTIVARRMLTRLRPEIDAALDLLSANLSARALSLDVQVVPELVANVDARLISHVIHNLLDNAVRYAPRGGRVHVAAVVDRELVLAIGNDGPPLTHEERVRVFERDFRSAERRAGARLGRHFGLYFCQLVAAAHHGMISLEERPGLPTVFVLRVPA